MSVVTSSIAPHRQHVLECLLSPHVTEKSTLVSMYRQYVFRVLPTANKIQIREAVETVFGVKVDSVRVVRVKGKVKQFRQHRGVRQDWKKAYVCLKEGHEINLV